MFAIACLRLCMQSGKTQIKKLFLKSFEDGGSEPWGKAVLSHMGVNLTLSLVLFAALVDHLFWGDMKLFRQYPLRWTSSPISEHAITDSINAGGGISRGRED